jgi:alpha-beta hydrolase superfamily lysophospholipase
MPKAASSLSVGEKVALIVVVALLVAVAAVALTALVTSVQVALMLWGGAVALLLAAAFLAPVRTGDLVAQPDPCASYADAVVRFGAMASAEPLNPRCHPQLLTHGDRTATAVVLLHGVSSCPRAFVDFAPLLHGRGHNVLPLRMPENGYGDRATDALKRLTAEKLRAWGDDAVDLAAGLGDEVVVVGISAGGTAAGWVAQNRAEVARVVLVAPMYGIGSLGGWLNAAVMRVTLLLPDFSIWKDPVLRARFQGLPHCYKRQSSRATGEILRLGHATLQQAQAGRAAAGAVALVTNAGDTAVDNALAAQVADAWEGHGVPVTRFEFAKADGLGHEVIDPLEPGADPGLTYPVLVGLIEGSPVDFHVR